MSQKAKKNVVELNETELKSSGAFSAKASSMGVKASSMGVKANSMGVKASSMGLKSAKK